MLTFSGLCAAAMAIFSKTFASREAISLVVDIVRQRTISQNSNLKEIQCKSINLDENKSNDNNTTIYLHGDKHCHNSVQYQRHKV